MTSRLTEEFDRIALLSAGRPEPHGYERWLLRFVPRPCHEALDLGCGTGTLTRELAGRCRRVLGIDLSPAMVQVARKRCADRPNVEFLLGDFLSLDLPGERFDCITAVAVLHHLPVQALERVRELLRPGGVLLIVDLFRDDGLLDHLASGLAFALDRVRHPFPRPRELQRAWAQHGSGDAYLTLAEARDLYRRVLPGAGFRRHLFWRYSVVWTKAA